ncbi:MAG: type II toxin-antitoxin system RelE/ParE family toxin [Candidatus Thermoplasmatota archaeon]|nr:type II toxin-antitoxin system RelE/ParE family toxin [Candidatus Thermoplasmatota archaeon]
MYSLETRQYVDRIFRKLSKTDPSQMKVVAKKIEKILEEPHHYKTMHYPLAGMRRVNFGSFVLIFSIDEQRRTVVLEDYEHHDSVYRV